MQRQIKLTSNNQDVPFRLNALDAIRGYAILAITLNHISSLTTRLGREGMQILTLTQIGYSSAAEIFVAISGFLFGFIHLRNPSNKRKVIHNSINRISKIYIYNLFLFSAILASINIFPKISQASNIFHEKNIVENIYIHVATLQSAPFLVGILFLYIYLIAILTALTVIFNNKTHIIFTSITIYALGWALKIGEVNYNIAIGFDILTWQLIFVLPAMFGSEFKGKRFSELFTNPRMTFSFGMAFVLLTAFFKALEVFKVLDFSSALPVLFDKEVLGIVRVAHALVILVVLAIMFEWLEYYIPLIFNFFRKIGALSLEVYCCSAIITYVCAGLWIEHGQGRMTYFLLAFTGTLMTALFGILLYRFRQYGKKARNNT